MIILITLLIILAVVGIVIGAVLLIRARRKRVEAGLPVGWKRWVRRK